MIFKPSIPASSLVGQASCLPSPFRTAGPRRQDACPTFRRDRGFALLAALGVLAVLTILAAAAAGSVSFTRGLAVERNRERALTSALSHGADLLGARGCEMLKSASGSTSTTLLAPAGEGVP